MGEGSGSPIVLVAFSERPPGALLEQLGASEALTDQPPWVFPCGRPARTVGHLLLGLLDPSNLALSGAVLAELPPPERMWVAYEWVGRLVIEPQLLGVLGDDLAGWEVQPGYERDDLVVLQPRSVAPPHDEGPQEGRPTQVSTPAEFVAAIDSSSSAMTLAPAAEVHAEPARWFGRLADPRVGGALALLRIAQSHGNDDTLLLRSPAAVGLDVGEPAAGLGRLVERNGLTVRAWGISYRDAGASAAALLEHEPLLDPSAVERVMTSHVQPSNCDYAIVAVMHAPVDPTATVAAGAVFEQDAWRNEQNLIVAAEVTVPIPVGQFIPVILPAWCMNRSLSPPKGGVVRPTALSMPQLPSTQYGVWQRVARAPR